MNVKVDFLMIFDFLLHVLESLYIIIFWFALLVIQIVWIPVALFIVAPWHIISSLLETEEK